MCVIVMPRVSIFFPSSTRMIAIYIYQEMTVYRMERER